MPSVRVIICKQHMSFQQYVKEGPEKIVVSMTCETTVPIEFDESD